jgi:hypothetical protein
MNLTDLPNVLLDVDMPFAYGGLPDRVVSPVFKLAQSRMNDGSCPIAAAQNTTKDAAQVITPSNYYVLFGNFSFNK